MLLRVDLLDWDIYLLVLIICICEYLWRKYIGFSVEGIYFLEL